MFLKRFFKFVPKSDYSRALDLFNDGHYSKALKIFEDLLARQSHEEDIDLATVELFACESHVALSKQKLNDGKLDEAIEEMETAVALKPEFADLRFGLGSSSDGRREIRRGESAFPSCAQDQPEVLQGEDHLARR